MNKITDVIARLLLMFSIVFLATVLVIFLNRADSQLHEQPTTYHQLTPNGTPKPPAGEL